MKNIIMILVSITCFTSSAGHTLDLLDNQSVYINEEFQVEPFSFEEKVQFEDLSASIYKGNDTTSEQIDYYYILKRVNINESIVELENGASFEIGWWYTGPIKNWKPGNRLRICYYGGTSNYIKIENVDAGDHAWGAFKQLPRDESLEIIARIPNSRKYVGDSFTKIVMKSGLIFQGPSGGDGYPYETEWKTRDKVFVFHQAGDLNGYDLWDMDHEEGGFIRNWTLIGNEKRIIEGEELAIDNVLELEQNLNKGVLSQPEATKAVSSAILNYAAGLKEAQSPVGVFLFLGPTGVGKTELAKVLTQELYKSQEAMIRFDMSHFNQDFSETRLIGTPPGYVNHEEGGQLTEALKDKPRSVVLLDEIEKAHPKILKIFLPVFDEGYIVDAKNTKISCRDVVFIMTSNLCSQQISNMFKQGYSADEILAKIEPELMSALSPELYNRLLPVVFRPLNVNVIEALVDRMLNEIIQKLKNTKKITLTFHPTVRTYLIKNGYHPTLGARPLKKLVQQKVVSTLSYALIKDKILPGSMMSLSYSALEDAWHVDWTPPAEPVEPEEKPEEPKNNDIFLNVMGG